MDIFSVYYEFLKIFIRKCDVFRKSADVALRLDVEIKMEAMSHEMATKEIDMLTN